MSRITFTLLFTSFTLFTKCDSDIDSANKKKMFEEGLHLARSTLNHFYDLFKDCINHSMAQKYLMDNLPRVINWPAKTTVGLAPKFSSNRKFFSNMIQTTEFHEMMAYDEQLLRSQWIKKITFCDKVVMDQDLLRDFYDREVDQSKV